MAENEQTEKLQVFRETTPNGLVLMVSIFSKKKNASHNPNHRLLLAELSSTMQGTNNNWAKETRKKKNVGTRS